MRIDAAWAVIATAMVAACASLPTAGPLETDASVRPQITAVDSAQPPRNAFVQLDRPGYVALIMVAPGRSATLVYPADSATNNHLTAGVHQLQFRLPMQFARTDSVRPTRPGTRSRSDSTRRGSTADARAAAPVPTPTSVYLLLVSSPQPLLYSRLLDKTNGVSIPLEDIEALNAVAKAAKATIATEPRELGAYYRRIDTKR